MNVADVDQVDIEEDNLSNSSDTIADPDEDDDAGIFIISNDYTSEDENTLAEKMMPPSGAYKAHCNKPK